MYWRRRFAALVTGIALATLAPVRGEVPRNPLLEGDTLQEVLDRIHEHAKDEAWRQGGWKDTTIEKWLDQLVAAISRGAELPELKLPVRQAGLQPADPGRPLMPGSLVIGREFKRLLGARNSLILADGDLEIGIPRDCVIVARGAINVSGARNCVIVSGTYISSTHDGEPGGGNLGSLLVSRGWLDIRSAHGSILLAGEGLTSERSENTLFVNRDVPPPVDRFPSHRGSRSVQAPDVPLEKLRIHPLAGKIKLLGMIQLMLDPAELRLPTRSAPVAGVVFRFADRRYVADLNEPIVDETGQPVGDLGGWTLTSASDRLAVFGNGDSQAIVRLGER